MNKKLIELLSKITPSNIKNQVQESLKNFSITVEGDKIEKIENKIIDDLKSIINKRDSATLSVKIDENDSLIINLKDDNSNIEATNKHIEILKDSISNVQLVLYVNKEVIDSKISIYSFYDFVQYLKSKTIEGILYSFDEVLLNKNYLTFEIFEEQFDECYSNIFFFLKSHEIKNTVVGRERILSMRKEVCYITNSLATHFIPTDFYLIKKSSNADFQEIFGKIVTLLSISSLFDICNYSNGFIEYKLNGYKTLTGKVNVNEIKFDEKIAEEYFKIYNWVYTGENISDRIGLARNIISLNIEDSIFKLSPDVFSSVRSAFEIYLKKNIQQYIEVKNKVSEFIVESSQRANKVVDTMGDSLKQNLIALLSFFVSIIVINAFSEGKLENIFSADIYLISIALLLASYVYCGYSIYEIYLNKKRYKELYLSLKNRYLDILDKNDLDRIFNYESDYTKDIKYIDSKTISLAITWVLLVSLFVIVISILKS